MWYMKLCYGILLIIAVFFSILYRGSFSLLLLCIMLVIPPVLYAISWYLRFHLHITLLPGDIRMHRNQEHTLILSVENNGWLPIGTAAATLVCTNLLSNQQEQMQLNFPIPARNTIQITVRILPEHCGMTRIVLSNVQVWDYLRLWSRKIKRAATLTIPVFPIGIDLTALTAHLEENLVSEGNISTASSPGNDASELYGVRAYTQGDRINRIHWKLSSRQDQLLVKEYGSFMQESLQIVLAIPENITVLQLDALLETTYTLSRLLLQTETPHTMIYYDETKQAVQHCSMQNQEDFWNCLQQIILNLPAVSAVNRCAACLDAIQTGSGMILALTTTLPNSSDYSIPSACRYLLTNCPRPAPENCFQINPDAIDYAITAALSRRREERS